MSQPQRPKDPDFLIKLENAIREKYGEEVIKHPKADWTQEQEKEYLKQIKEIYQKELKNSKPSKKIDINGVLLPEELINTDSNRVCIECDIYSFSIEDDLYMLKFKCCKKCYIDSVDKGREDKWLQSMK